MDAPKTRREREIWLACDALWSEHAQWNQLTGELIRERLARMGFKKGSPNEIYRYRKTWQAARGISANGDNPQSLAVTDPIARAVDMVRQQIHQEAAKQISEVEKQHTDQCNNLSAERESALIQAQQMAEQLDQVRENAAALQAQLAQKELMLADLINERNKMVERVELLNSFDSKQQSQIEQLYSRWQSAEQLMAAEKDALRVQLRDASKRHELALTKTAKQKQKIEQLMRAVRALDKQLRKKEKAHAASSSVAAKQSKSTRTKPPRRRSPSAMAG